MRPCRPLRVVIFELLSNNARDSSIHGCLAIGQCMADRLLELNKVSVRRGMGIVLQDFSLTVNAGDCVILHGINGSGKSTVIETAARLLPMESGSVKHHSTVVCDAEGRRISPNKPFGLTLQENCLVGGQTVQQHLDTICALSNKTFDVRSILENYNIANRRNDRIAHLSGGQQRKVAVISGLLPAMISEQSELVLLDEPDSGLDDDSITQLVSHIHQLRNNGNGIVIATHDTRLFECATKLHDLTSSVSKTPTNTDKWVVTSKVKKHSFVRLKAGLRYNTTTLLSVQRNWLAAFLVMGTLLTVIEPFKISEEKIMLMGFTLAPAFALGLVGDAVFKILDQQRAIDWWRAQHNLIPNSFTETFFSGLIVTTISMQIFLQNLDLRIALFGAIIALLTTFCVRFLQLSTIRLARKNAVFVRLLTPILILPWGLVVEYCANL